MTLPPVVTSAAFQAAHILLHDLGTRIADVGRMVDPPPEAFWEQVIRDVEHVRRLLGGNA